MEYYRLEDIFILQRIYGLLFDDGIWRKKYNHELHNLLGQPNIISIIKTNIVG